MFRAAPFDIVWYTDQNPGFIAVKEYCGLIRQLICACKGLDNTNFS